METTDVGLAAYIYSLGKDVEICRLDTRHCVFRFEGCPEIREWQSGQALINGVIFLNSYRTLIKGVKNSVGKVS
ncbi:hypothetical protein ACFLV6_02465 [Chloroflexota bacterium]